MIVLLSENRTQGETLINSEWRYCLRNRGQFHALVADASYYDGYGDIVGVGPLVLSGDYVAYETSTVASGGRYDAGPIGEIYLRDLVTGVSRTMIIYPLETCGLPALVLGPNGIAAWLVGECAPLAPGGALWSWLVEALDGRTGRSSTLESTATTHDEANPFADLQLEQCIAGCAPVGKTVAWWTDNGAWRSASIP